MPVHVRLRRRTHAPDAVRHRRLPRRDGLGPLRRRRYSTCGDTRDRLRVSVSDVALRSGTRLVIRIDGTRVGTIELDTHGNGRLTRRADRLPSTLRLEGHPFITARVPDGQLVLTNGR
jgi:hypothetical protein